MNGLTRSLLVIFLIFFSVKLISQDAFQEIDRVYGLDPLLFNGRKYTYFFPQVTGGNQFLLSTEYKTGEVTIKGNKFEGIDLNYDIYNQLLLIQYAGESGSLNIIEVSKAWLESFRIGNLEFKLLDYGNGQRFYQVLGEGPFFILYYWRKDLKLDASYGASNFAFTPPIKSQYVLIGDKLWPFRNKRSLISIFDRELKQDIKSYINRNKVRMKNASDQTMTQLINYIGNLE